MPIVDFSKPYRVVKPCDTSLPSPRHGGKLALPPKWIVLHATESDPRVTNAWNIASWFAQPKGIGSAHLVVDDDANCYRSLEDDQVPQAARGANTTGLHIELLAPAGASLTWSADDWLSHAILLNAAADLVADWCRAYEVPVEFVDAEGLIAGNRGITTHAEVTKAFKLDDHVDPGPNFPIVVFIEKVRERV